MEGQKQASKSFYDLMDIIHFTEHLSAKIHTFLEEADIYRTIKEEFAKSKRYTMSISLLTDNESELRVVGTSLAPKRLKAGEKASGMKLKKYKIDLNKSSIYKRVVREGETVQVKVSDVIVELFPEPLACLISKIMGYERKESIITPLKRQRKIIGAFAMSSTELAEYFIPSVKNLACHISNALELACEYKERKKAQKKVETYQKRLRSLISELTLVEDRERRRLALDLHDSIGQLLVLCKIKLEKLEKNTTSSESAALMKEIKGLLERAVECTRSLTFRLSPPVLYELGLEAALRWFTRFISKHYGIRVALEIELQKKVRNERLRIVLFRMVRELLLNVAKHAKTERAKASLRREGENIRITVEDKGVGFNSSILDNSSLKNRGYGLFSIREHLSHLEGKFIIQSAPGEGTKVTLLVPVSSLKKVHRGRRWR